MITKEQVREAILSAADYTGRNGEVEGSADEMADAVLELIHQDMHKPKMDSAIRRPPGWDGGW